MSKLYSVIKVAGICIALAGGVWAMSLGQSKPSSYMMAAGALMFVAIKIAEWWERR